MTTLACILEREFPICHLRLRGTLSLATVPQLRATGLKAFADQPDLVLIDVSGLEVEDDVTLTAFPALVHQGSADNVSVMLYGVRPALAVQLDRIVVARQVPTFETREQALAAHARWPAPTRAQIDLAPDRDATALARDLVDRCCERWGVRHVADDAALVVTELVANAVQHARTGSTVVVTLRERYLHVAVRDRSSRRPRRITADNELESGRGLLIVDGVATSWGVIDTVGGKVVWATLRLRRGR
ncbi:ATP-binding protein [Dactylosporangium aurantiacum]|uniref:ATP-binding protein n=1 Tax=Dactylosporangium aurantiacum TaxID=35754 RepID=A0A9Q9INY4_9ACTN|nr:ATP-binding protein [Dactylosporangium aurantiacum]MDG6103816.1 ATP-binding protein [Dactylosporangium aurantiacum]UWZ58981.1 ATP-binding protein [Dactylosporangium aurantiacum]